MNNKNLKKTTEQFALETIESFETLPKNEPGRIVGRPLRRAGTAVGANCRAAGRATSTADFISKRRTVEEKTDGSSQRIESLAKDSNVAKTKVSPWMKEVNERLATAISSIHTARKSGDRSMPGDVPVGSLRTQ